MNIPFEGWPEDPVYHGQRRVAGLTGEPFPDLAEAAQSDPEVAALVRDGRGLKEAKEAIERMKV